MKIPSKLKPKKWMVIVLIIAIIAAIAGFGITRFKNSKSASEAKEAVQEAKVTRQTIVSSITGSAVIMPKDQYSITSLVSGDILSADFEQGDVVAEGDVLYKIDSSDVETSIKNADLSLQRSQNNYNDALDAQNDLTVKSDVTGVIKKLYIKKGDTVNAGAQIADIYDDSTLLLTIPFNETDANVIYPGAVATVSVSGTSDILSGTVKEVKASAYAKDGNMLVKDVVISVPNPGTLMISDTAVATVGTVSCNDAGTFEYITEKTITAKASGDVAAIYASEGDRIKNGAVVAMLTSETVTKNIRSNSLSLQEANLSKDNAQKKLEDYTITAPISGTVIEKNIKAGDKLDNTNASTVMAVIYDMSSLELDLSVDELDIKNVEIGQEVTITSDALDGKMYHGEVINVSINGTTEGGVTTYPVKIEVIDFDDELLPGMNVDAEIVTSKAENVLCVPISAVNRGNTVYVKGEKTDEKDRAPEGYKSVKVETGVFNDNLIEIVSGLSENDSVWVPQVEVSNNMFGFPGMGGMPGGMGGMPGGGMGGGMPGGGMSGGGMRSGGNARSGGGGMR